MVNLTSLGKRHNFLLIFQYSNSNILYTVSLKQRAFHPEAIPMAQKAQNKIFFVYFGSYKCMYLQRQHYYYEKYYYTFYLLA